MLYQNDPIMPFEHAGKLKYKSDHDYDSVASELYEPGASSGFTSGYGGVTAGSAAWLRQGI